LLLLTEASYHLAMASAIPLVKVAGGAWRTKALVEDQKIGATIQGHIPLKGAAG